MRDQAVCYITARVFDSSDEGSPTSTIIDGLYWAALQGASVINMSLGGGLPNNSMRNLVETLYTQMNVLVIAAAGNDGLNIRSYPGTKISEMISSLRVAQN